MLHHLPPTIEDPPPVPAYREAAPPADLAQVVACLWTRHGGDGATPTTRVVPDGCADLMWITDGGTAGLVVAGPDTHAHLSTLG
ncbi:MAG: DUF6597 domain-containing transcriptional factor, partial [Acidimicrobiales bacterium]